METKIESTYVRDEKFAKEYAETNKKLNKKQYHAAFYCSVILK